MASTAPARRDTLTLGALGLAIILLIVNIAYIGGVVVPEIVATRDKIASAQTALSSQMSEFTGRGRGVVVWGRYAVMPLKNCTGSTLANWKATKLVILASPAIGANHWVYWINPGMYGGTLSNVADGYEYMLYVLNGTATLTTSFASTPYSLVKDDFVFINHTSTWDLNATDAYCRIYLAKKAFDSTRVRADLGPPNSYKMKAADVAFGAKPAVRPQVAKTLVPSGVSADRYDLRLVYITAWPGGGTGIIEHHDEQHGVLMYEGEGVYLLGNTKYPLKAAPYPEGDFIWVGPFVVHEFTNTHATANATYLLTRG